MHTLLIISSVLLVLSGMAFTGIALWGMNNGLSRTFGKNEFLIKGWQPQLYHFKWSQRIFIAMLFITLIISYLKENL